MEKSKGLERRQKKGRNVEVCVFGSSLSALLHHQNCLVEEAFPVLWRWYGAYVPNKEPFSMRKTPLRAGGSEPVLVLRGTYPEANGLLVHNYVGYYPTTGSSNCEVIEKGR
jgi:hypothetical protein